MSLWVSVIESWGLQIAQKVGLFYILKAPTVNIMDSRAI